MPTDRSSEIEQGPPQVDHPDDLLRVAALASLDGFAVLRAVRDSTGKIVDFVFGFYNPAAEALIGRSAEEVLGKGVVELFPNVADHLLALWTETIASGEPVVEEIESVPGKRWVRQQLVPLQDALLVTSHDISDRRQIEAELEHRAFHDPLTDLPNRVLAVQRISESLGRAGRNKSGTAVLFIDLDRFKSINDTFGHAAGDLVLQSLATRLRRNVRARDTVARLSGDEFVVCLDGIASLSDGQAIVEKLLAAMRQPFAIADRQVPLTASIGIALSTEGVDADTLVSRADAAAYEAKRRGSNRLAVYDEQIGQRMAHELLVEQELMAGISLGELRLHFQPTISLATNEITAVEALVRWEHPNRGLLDPSNFLQVAEDAGLMGELGRWVRAAACESLTRLLAAPGTPKELVMWVNVAASELTNTFCDELSSVLALHNISPLNLGVELSETAIVSDMATTELVLERLTRMGVHIGIDDFGAGSSSLTYLQRLRANVLKVDHTFVHSLDRSLPGDPNAEGAKEIAAALISFGQRLGMQVVAEGVESSKQLEILIELGCDCVSGRHLANPADEASLLQQFAGASMNRLS